PPPPVAILDGGVSSPVPYTYPIAYVYERYFFTDGTQTVRMAFVGTDIARSGIDGPYRVHARLSIGGYPYMTLRPIGDWAGPVVEWRRDGGRAVHRGRVSGLRPRDDRHECRLAVPRGPDPPGRRRRSVGLQPHPVLQLARLRGRQRDPGPDRHDPAAPAGLLSGDAMRHDVDLPGGRLRSDRGAPSVHRSVPGAHSRPQRRRRLRRARASSRGRGGRRR